MKQNSAAFFWLGQIRRWLLGASIPGFAAIFFSSAWAGVGVLAGTAELLEPERAFQLSARWRDTKTIEIDYRIENGYYLYRDRLRFAIDGQAVNPKKIKLPKGLVKDDANFGRVATYRDSVRILVPFEARPRILSAPGNKVEPIRVAATSQGCADAGVCYPPQMQILQLVRGNLNVVRPNAAAESVGFSRLPDVSAATPTLAESLKRPLEKRPLQTDDK